MFVQDKKLDLHLWPTVIVKRQLEQTPDWRPLVVHAWGDDSTKEMQEVNEIFSAAIREWLEAAGFDPDSYEHSHVDRGIHRYKPNEYIAPHWDGGDLTVILYLAGTGDMNSTHAHGHYHAPTQSGVTTFLDPRGASASMVRKPGSPDRTFFSFVPIAGLVVAFPSHVPHFTTPHFDAGERVAASSTFTIKRKT